MNDDFPAARPGPRIDAQALAAQIDGLIAEGPNAARFATAQRDIAKLANKVAGLRLDSRPMLRTVHHLACTGGSLIAKAIQAQPNIFLLSEVDPLSTQASEHNASGFAPSDLILMARHRDPNLPAQSAIDMFLGGLRSLVAFNETRGRALVIRDHSHSHFCRDADIDARPTVLEMLTPHYDVRPVVTVRHPLDSWLAQLSNGWITFAPFTIDEYARRYLAFLDRHEGVEIVRYEDFIDDPDGTLRRIAACLAISYYPGWQELLGNVWMSGDSGRSGAVIERRDRREISPELADGMAQSSRYAELCGRLGYPPGP